MIYRLERDDASKAYRVSYSHGGLIATLRGAQAELAAATYARHLEHDGEAVADVFLNGLIAGLSVGESNFTFGNRQGADSTIVERARALGGL